MSTPLAPTDLPTTLGTAIAACLLPQSGATAFAATCERAISSLKAPGSALPLTASATYASALGAIVATLDRDRTADGRQLASAKTQGDQGSAARALAEAYQRAATAAARLPPGPIGGSASVAIVAALRRLAGGYQSLASAAESDDSKSYRVAQTEIGHADSALSAGFTQLQQDGYTTG